MPESFSFGVDPVNCHAWNKDRTRKCYRILFLGPSTVPAPARTLNLPRFWDIYGLASALPLWPS